MEELGGESGPAGAGPVPSPPAPASIGIEAVRGARQIAEEHAVEREHRGPDATPSSSYVRVHQDERARRRTLPILGQNPR
jgi:hypothetical protein